mgnify:FL=1
MAILYKYDKILDVLFLLIVYYLKVGWIMSKKLLMINLLFVILIVFLVFILYPLDPQPSMMKENETKISLRITTMFAGTDPATIVYETHYKNLWNRILM